MTTINFPIDPGPLVTGPASASGSSLPTAPSPSTWLQPADPVVDMDPSAVLGGSGLLYYLDAVSLSRFPDVKLVVPVTSEQPGRAGLLPSHSLRVSRLVLASASPAMRAILTDSEKHEHSDSDGVLSVLLEGVKAEHLETIGHFLRTGWIREDEGDPGYAQLRESFLSIGIPWDQLRMERVVLRPDMAEDARVTKTEVDDNQARCRESLAPAAPRRRGRPKKVKLDYKVLNDGIDFENSDLDSGESYNAGETADDSAVFVKGNTADFDRLNAVNADGTVKIEIDDDPTLEEDAETALYDDHDDEDYMMGEDLPKEGDATKRAKQVAAPKAPRRPKMAADDPAKKHHCTICNQRYSDTGRFKNHLLVHKRTDDKHNYFCVICETPFEEKKLWKQHVQDEHVNKKYTCDFCGKVYSGVKYKNFQAHLKKHKQAKEQGGKVLCPQCGKEVKNQEIIHTHRHYHGKFHQNRCYQCPDEEAEGAKFDTWEEHKLHVEKVHAGVFRHVCGMCPKVFDSESEKRQHRKKEHPDEWAALYRKKVCEVCGKMVYLAGFKKHVNDEHGTEQIQCPHCPKVLKSQASLKDHIAACHNRFPCDICGKSQRNKQMYQMHVFNMHTPDGQKPFQCRYCPKGFGKKRGWQEHENIHTNSRPYKCRFDGCDMAFSSVSNTIWHEKAVHKGMKRAPRQKKKQEKAQNNV